VKLLAAVAAAALAVLPALRRPGAPSVVSDPSHPGMILVPAGPFVMGCTEEEAAAGLAAYGGDASYFRSCTPRRTVELPAFWIDRTEVTSRRYHAFVVAAGHPPPTHQAPWASPYLWENGAPRPELADHPVTLVSFTDADAYCRWRGLTLPSEEEWEKAARGADGRRYPWGDVYDPTAVAGAQRRSALRLDRIERWTDWWRRVYRGRMRGREVGTFPVGRFPSGGSPWGALDMAGNVFEWVDAFFDPYPGSTATHPEFGRGYRVVRGGDWYLDRIYHQAAMRLRAPEDHKVPTIGFRCACRRTDDRHPAPASVGGREGSPSAGRP
jgi:formylglycine-generating enzyme required for sulfatase activity